MKVATKDGVELAVVRPADPRRAVALAEDAIGLDYETGKHALMDVLRVQPYTFVGLACYGLGQGRIILDPVKFTPINKLTCGDSFVSWPGLRALLVAQHGRVEVGTTVDFGVSS